MNKNYLLMPEARTYVLGVEALREYSAKGYSMQSLYTRTDGSWIVRPLTFKENLLARVETYNTIKNADGSVKTDDERLKLFNKWLDSCTGIAYKAGTTKFKIVQQSLDLIEIPSEFNQQFMQIDYDSIDCIEFDSSDAKYITSLSLSKIKSHPAWLAAVEGDVTLLSEYSDIVFSLLKEKYNGTNGMGFYVRSNTGTDELRALWVDYLYGYSGASGDYSLNNGGSFLLVAPSQKISTRNKGRTK